jgi:glycosyltransferase involved in cell wall biosynthesis
MAAQGALLRILHFAAGNLYGGVESLLKTLASHGGASPHMQAEYAVCFDDRLAAELRAAGAVVHTLGAARFSRPWTVWRARRRLARVLRERRIDVLLSHCCWAHLLAGPVGRRAGSAVVYWNHELLGGEHWVERGAAHVRPDLVLSCSRFTADAVARVFPEAQPVVQRNAVAAETVDRASARANVRAELATPAEDVVIVTACRLETWKGHRLLIDALVGLRDRPGWTAWVAGGVQRAHEQVYLDSLRDAARSGGIADRVRFLGHRSDVRRLLAAADVHCQPNTGPEPFGIAYVEALYAGLPVVSTRFGGAAEIVTNECGVLVSPGDRTALTAALASLVDDPAARTRLGAAGPARAAELCAPETVLPRLEALLQDLAPAAV